MSRNAVPAHAQELLRALHRWNFYLEHFAVERHDRDSRTEERVGQLHGQVHDEIRLLATEGRVGLHVDFDVEISSDTTLAGQVLHRLALLGHANHLAIVDAARDRNLYLLFPTPHPLPFALVALLLRYFAGAVADGARAHVGELPEDGVTHLAHAARTRAGLAVLYLGTGLRPAPIACFAGRDFGDKHLARRAKHGIFKRDLEIDRDVEPSRRRSLGMASPPTKYVAENIPEVELHAALPTEFLLKLREIKSAKPPLC